MHHAVAYGIDFVIRLDAAELGVGENVEHSFHSAFVVCQAEFAYGFRTVVELIFEESVGQTDFSTPPSAITISPFVSMSLYFTELLPQLSTSIFILITRFNGFVDYFREWPDWLS